MLSFYNITNVDSGSIFASRNKSHTFAHHFKINLTMNRVVFLIIIISCFAIQIVHGQKNIYTTTGGEWIFSWANVTQGGFNANAITRFSPVVNIQSQVHIDMSEKFGFFTGLNLRNVGFIWDDPTTPSTRHKARVYTLGLPIGFKVGNMSGLHLFAGYELELPFNYKEKLFVNEDKKDKESYWFSNRVPGLYHSVLAGVQMPKGMQVKFKYYLTNFFNKGFAANDGNGNIVYPYQTLDANVFYISLSFQILKGAKFYYTK